jgi:hypothetical protein
MTRLSFAVLAAAIIVTTTAADAAVMRKAPPAAGSSYDCADEMGDLRYIRPAIFAETQFGKAVVKPVCEDGEDGNPYADGNAAGLHTLIARKPMLVEALGDAKYIPSEVVGVRFGGGQSVILYVHHQR